VQLRHLRYFVSIVDAGSFSRAAATIHVAQPALSQQIAELEARLGVPLLHRSARGVRTTTAGDALYREAMAIIRRIEELPVIVRATEGELVGAVSIGMSTTLAATLASPMVELCRSSWPKVSLRFATGGSALIKARVDSGTLDMGLVFEDEAGIGFDRLPLFRHRLYLVRQRSAVAAASITLQEVAAIPLILPAQPNVTRSLLDRAFAAAGLQPRVATEMDALYSMLAGVHSGLGSATIPKGDLSDLPGHDNLVAVPIEPPLFLTASIATRGGVPLSRAGDSVRAVLASLVETRFTEAMLPGAEWLGD
jgi:LysR family nitrogen assimilation transcriptional regulator